MRNKNLENKVSVKIIIEYNAKELSLEEIQRDVDDLRRGGTEYGRVTSAMLEYGRGHYIKLK